MAIALDSAALSLALVAAVAGAVATTGWLILRLAGRLAARTKGDLDDELARRLPLPLAVILGLAAATATLQALAPTIDAAVVTSLGRAFIVAFVVVATWTAVRAVRVVLEAAGKRRERFQIATRLGGRLAAVVLYTAAFLTILSQYGIAVTPILTGLGIAGLAVALALQDTLANFFAGIWMQTGRSMQPGHYIRMEGEKLEGYVEQVGWRTTRLRTLGGSTVVIPNSRLGQAIVTDHNLPSSQLSIVMDFRVGYEADPNRVMTALVEEAKEVAKANLGLVASEEPFAQLSGFDDGALKFSLILRVDEFVHQYQVQHAMRLRILERFRNDGIRVPYPTRHNLQESLEPAARRVAHAPGGFGPVERPPRPAPAPEQGPDPRAAEAEKAKQDIAAIQEEKATSTST